MISAAQNPIKAVTSVHTSPASRWRRASAYRALTSARSGPMNAYLTRDSGRPGWCEKRYVDERSRVVPVAASGALLLYAWWFKW